MSFIRCHALIGGSGLPAILYHGIVRNFSPGGNRNRFFIVASWALKNNESKKTQTSSTIISQGLIIGELLRFNLMIRR